MSRPIDEATADRRQAVGSALSLARRRAGLDQRQVAEELGATQTTISHWETGRRTPDIVTAELLAGLYGLTLDELVGRVPLPPLRRG